MVKTCCRTSSRFQLEALSIKQSNEISKNANNTKKNVIEVENRILGVFQPLFRWLQVNTALAIDTITNTKGSGLSFVVMKLLPTVCELDFNLSNYNRKKGCAVRFIVALF